MQCKTIAKQLAEKSEVVASLLLPHGKRQGHEWCVGSIAGEAGTSLKVCLSGDKAGVWCDFATGDKGDLLELWCQVKQVPLREAIQQASQYLGIVMPRLNTPATQVYARPQSSSYRSLNPLSEGMKYLTEVRKLTEATLKAFEIGENQTEIVFPYFRDQALVQIKYLQITRHNEKKQMRVEANCEPCLFGWQALPENVRTIALTEGEIDAMSLHQYGIAALSIPFGGGKGAKQQWIAHEFDRLMLFDEIYLCLDNDAEGKAATAELIERLGSYRCRLVTLPYKDANACLQAGVTQATIQACFNEATRLDPKELKPAEYFVEAVIQQFDKNNMTEQGINLPWNKAQGKILFRPAELSLWTGINGHGKSQLLGQIILSSMEQGSQVCIASLELKPERLLMRLTRQASALPIPTAEYIHAIYDWFSGKLWLFNVTGNTKAEKLLEVFLYARQRYGIDTFVIDSLMKCGFAEDDYNGQKLFVEKLCDFKNEHNCHIHLVAHPRKGSDESTPPNKLDIKGSGAITDLADNCFTVWRNKPKENKLQLAQLSPLEQSELEKQPDGLLICDKQRNGEWEGKIALWFDPNSYQYLDYAHQKPKRFVPYSKLLTMVS